MYNNKLISCRPNSVTFRLFIDQNITAGDSHVSYVSFDWIAQPGITLPTQVNTKKHLRFDFANRSK